jgi:membrane associated rhomboid family serine protease
MSWQDRPYAYDESAPEGWGRSVRSSTRWLWGGSIVSTLIAVNVAIFAAGMLFPPLGESLYEFGAMQAAAVLQGQVWRLLTAQYLHADLMHVFFNMLGLYFFGRVLESRWSPRGFFILYTLAGLVGNLLYTFLLGMVLRGYANIPAVGASGCVFGLLGMVATLHPGMMIIIYFVPMRVRTAALLFGALAVGSIISHGSNWPGELCHLCGLLFGVWWAWKGESWWSVPRRFGVRRTAGAAPSKARRFQQLVEERRADAELIDDILRKVHAEGLHSLTDRERRALQQATERQQRREAELGRVDRL